MCYFSDRKDKIIFEFDEEVKNECVPTKQHLLGIIYSKSNPWQSLTLDLELGLRYLFNGEFKGIKCLCLFIINYNNS